FVAGKIHLRREFVVAAPRHLKVDMRWARPFPADRVGAGPDGREAVTALGVGREPGPALEIGVQRRRIGVGLVVVAAVCVRLPDVYEGTADGLALLVQHSAADLDDLTERALAVALDL